MARTRSKVVVLIAFLNFNCLNACLAQTPTPTPSSVPASVEGVIVNKRLSAVIVRLESTPTNPLTSFDGYSAMAEADGSFRFEDIVPGAYRLVAEAKPSMYGEYGSRPPERPGEILQVKPGEHVRGLSLELFPDPKTICGHVVDENGRPLEVNIEQYTRGYFWEKSDGPRADLVQPIRWSDSNGYFNIPSRSFNHESFFIRAGGVWYPSTRDFAHALAIEPANQSATGCQANVQIKRMICDGRVVGALQGALPFPADEYRASLFAANPSGTLFLTDSHPLFRPDGVDFDGVCAGSYTVVLEHHLNGETQDFASAVFQSKEPITTVTLTEMTQNDLARIAGPKETDTPRATLTGTLRLDGLNWDQACPVHVSRQAELLRDGDNNGTFALIDAKGNYTFDKLKPGIYRLTFGETAHGAAYIKSFTVDGQSTDPAHFALANGQAAHVDAVFGNDPRDAAGHLRADYTAEAHYLPNGTHPAASISGSIRGEAARGTIVKLSSVRFNSARSTIYQMPALEDGTFQFDSVDPGIYELYADGENNQLSAYRAKGPGREGIPVVLSAGQRLDGADIQVYPKSSLCGKVFDSTGKQVKGIEVWVQGNRTEPAANGSPNYWREHVTTDNEGRYSVPGIGPASLLVWAQEGDKKTFYPSGIDYSQALYVDLGPDDPACVYDIYLPPPGKDTAERGFTISGTVEGQLDPALGDHFYVNLIPLDSSHAPRVKPLEIKSAGNFEVQQVWPGTYTLTVTASYGNGRVPCGMPSSICFGYFEHLLASQRITVASADLEGLKLSIGTLPTLDGEVVIDGKEPDAEHPAGNPVMSGELAREGVITAKLDSHGHFSFPTLDVRDYRISLDKYQPQYYVQSILLDGKSVVGRTIQLHFGQHGHLVIQLATDGATGTLTRLPGQPSVDPYRDLCRYFGSGSSLVLMIPDPLPADNSGIIEGTESTDGLARVSEVPPGHYRVLAADDLVLPGNRFFRPPGSVFLSSHDDLVKLGALGMPVEINPHQHFEFNAPVVTAQMRRMLAEEGFRSTF
jgi:protocatechuate 3,4-dioxygenase beta subunit